MKAFAAAGASHHAMALAAELLVMVESRFPTGLSSAVNSRI
jgi:hypothetical protein